MGDVFQHLCLGGEFFLCLSASPSVGQPYGQTEICLALRVLMGSFFVSLITAPAE